MNLKKIVSSFLLLSFLVAIFPAPKAQAAIIPMTATKCWSNNQEDDDAIACLITRVLSVGVVATGFLVGGLVTLVSPAWGVGIMAYGIVLDADGNLPMSSIERNLTQLFPQIDNQNLVRELAKVVQETYEAEGKPDSLLSINPHKVNDILQKSDLSEAEIAEIVHTLN